MAIFHCQTKPVSRSGGCSSVASDAYRTGEKLRDERTGLVHDYTRRSGVESADLLLPKDAQALTRSQVWNGAEAAEVRKDARTAREWVIALPSELDPAERRALALEFAGKLVERYGVAVDVAIHKPGKKGDDRNHHAHLLTTTRQIGPEGFGAKADLELSDKARIGRGLEPARKEIEAVRALWAGLTNEHLERAGRSERIDHRSLKAQGIEREPTKHLGPAATAIERANKQSRLRADHQEAAAFKQASAAELATEAKTVSAELAALLEHRAALERQKVDREIRAQQHRDQIAEAIAKSQAPEPTAAPAVETLAQLQGRPGRRNFGTPAPEASPRPAETDAQRSERKALDLIDRGPPGTAERLYDLSLADLQKRVQAEATAALEAARAERRQWDQARSAHQADKPGMVRLPGRLDAWKQAGVKLDQAGRSLTQRETAAERAARPEVIQAAAKAKIAQQMPQFTERAAADRQARLDREAEARRQEQEKRRAEYERTRLSDEFAKMASGRAFKGFGYRDDSEKWRAWPAELKEKIEDYNRLPKDQQPAALERIGKDPQTPKLLKKAKEISLEQGRGR